VNVVYEVNLRVDAAIAQAYRAWLREHAAQMLRLPGFVSAECFDVAQDEDGSGDVALCVQYRLRDAAALDAYLAGPAAAMRAEAVVRFGGRFRAQRRVLHRFEFDG
jgi:quinol monooxygenase YgiN